MPADLGDIIVIKTLMLRHITYNFKSRDFNESLQNSSGEKVGGHSKKKLKNISVTFKANQLV